MLNPLVFDKAKIDEITDRLLPSPGRIMSGKKREEILPAMTTEVAELLVPKDQKEAMLNLDSLNESLDAAVPPVRGIMSKVSRKDVQDQIANIVKAEFAAHNTKIESDNRVEAERAEAARKKAEEEIPAPVPQVERPPLDLESYAKYPDRKPNRLMAYVILGVIILAAGGALYISLR